MPCRIVMIGAGSVVFPLTIARELVRSDVLKGSTLVLMDIDADLLARSEAQIRKLVAQTGSRLKLEATLDRRVALSDADFVVTSYAPHRIEFWIKDIEIADRHGAYAMEGENGGPAGQIHALRNITIMMDIVRDIKELCPDAWLMNFTNPMSMVCTYLCRHTPVKSLGFCHQVHGSFGHIAEMLDMEPGDLEVVTAGINHMNFLLDIRKKGCSISYMEEFFEAVHKSPYWQKAYENMPEQVQMFTLEFLDTFGIYPVGFDSHICEYIPFFYTKEEWEKMGYRSLCVQLEGARKIQEEEEAAGVLSEEEIERKIAAKFFALPKDPSDPYYRETPALINTAQYLDSMVLPNNGCVSNLPADAVVDIPAVVVGGRVRGVQVGELPPFAAELCRRQIVIHELIARAAVEGERRLFLEALCLDPFVHSLNAAKRICEDYIEEYRKYLPQGF